MGPEHSIVTDRYRQLLAMMEEADRGARGWKVRAAKRLGVSPSHLSKIAGGDRLVGIEVAHRAAERIGIPMSFFTANVVSEKDREHVQRAISGDIIDDEIRAALAIHAQDMKAAADTGHPAIEVWALPNSIARRVRAAGESASPQDVEDMARAVLAIQPVMYARRLLDPSVSSEERSQLAEALVWTLAALRAGTSDVER